MIRAAEERREVSSGCGVTDSAIKTFPRHEIQLRIGDYWDLGPQDKGYGSLIDECN